jgi:aminoglycoside phosphotransferase (APT) family kinase protein
MAAPIRRDLAQTCDVLTRWVAERTPEADVRIIELAAPTGGVSSDTLLLDVDITASGHTRLARWVVRIQATAIQIYQEPGIERQFRILQTLGKSTNVPVPRTRWYEPDPVLLGAPFFVMDRIDGRVPSNYNAPGWLAELPPARREQLWLDAIEKLARVHNTDVALVRFLDRPALGPTGLDQEIAAWNDYFEWSAIPRHPNLVRAQRWLADHSPRNKPTGLAWGDAQFSNMIFDDTSCVAVIDWETVSLGGAEEDISWWLVFDDFYSTMCGLQRLPGLGDRKATIEAWEQFSGRRLDEMDWHEMFATWRVAMISERAIALYAASGNPLPGIGPGDGNPYVVRLAQLLASGS